MIYEMHRGENLFMTLLCYDDWRCVACHHTPIFLRINIIAVTTRNNLISDMNVSGAPLKLEVDVYTRFEQKQKFRRRTRNLLWAMLRHIFVHLPEFIDSIWTLIDDVWNRIIKRHFICYFLPLFCFAASKNSTCLMFVVSQIIWGKQNEMNCWVKYLHWRNSQETSGC